MEDKERIVPMLKLELFPFLVGASTTPHNAPNIPDMFAFELQADLETGLITQKGSLELYEQLKNAYEKGSLLGTAMDDTDIGRGYALDFMDFIKEHLTLTSNPRILEIGAGRGYLLSLLQGQGADVIGLEPGVQNKKYWEKYNVPIHADFFPSPNATGEFDAIISYAVIEHIEDISEFLENCKNQLRNNSGLILFAVPDVENAIEYGDPSMLLHEHYSYFTRKSLTRLMALNGLKPVTVSKAHYGGAIYIAAQIKKDSEHIEVDELTDYEELIIKRYGATVLLAREKIKKILDQKDKTIGIYCPVRTIGLLPLDVSNENLRFFDDDPDLLGKHYPPFAIKVENRQMLLDKPVDELWIMSWTFGKELKKQLQENEQFKNTKVLTAADFFNF